MPLLRTRLCGMSSHTAGVFAEYEVKPVSDVPPALVTPPAPGIPPVAGGVEPPAPAGPDELPPAPPVRHAASTADGASSASPPSAPPAAVPLLPPVREPPPPPAPPVVVPPLPPRLPPVLAGASDSAVGPLADFPQPPRTRNPLVASPIRTWDIRIGRICMKYRSTRRRGQSEKCRGATSVSSRRRRSHCRPHPRMVPTPPDTGMGSTHPCPWCGGNS